MYSPLLEQIQAVLERGVAAGLFRAGVDPMQLYVTIVSLGHFYLANIHTLSTIFGAGLETEAALRAREAHSVAVVLGLSPVLDLACCRRRVTRQLPCVRRAA